jgi:Tol biopolymer transport system component/DNA-binding winged helix-turn-helix (wHTH) protein
MTQAVPTSRVIKFGVFDVDLHKGEVRKNGLKLRLRGQPFQVLSILLEHPGKLVSREEFQQRLWTNDETFVDFEHGLNAIVNRLREVLGDSPENPHFIETVPRRGYRWMLPVEGIEERSIPTLPRHKWLSWAAVLLVLIGLVGGVVISILSTSKAKIPEPAPEPALTSVPLTARPGYESLPSFSPDGNQVAFGWSGENERESHIYVKLIGTDGPPLQLTTRPGSDNNPVWSPDGRFIAFLRDLRETAAILLIPALGGPAHKIAEIRLADVPAPFLAWSPDGNSLVISHKDAPKGPAALFVVAIDTGEKRRLTSPPPEAIGNASGDTSPAFSPDGRTLAFIRMIGLRPELYLLHVSDTLQPVGEAKRIPLGKLGCYAPAWTEDGREIVISSGGLWRIGVSGSDTRSGQPARLPFGDNALCPAISRRGHRLAYAAGFGHYSIWRMAAPGGPSARDVPRARSFNRSFISSTRSDLFPHFSPDGRRIAFVSTRSGKMEIWVCDSDGSSPVQLTSFHGPTVTTPRWSPDGRRIAFDSDAAGGDFDIWVIGADGGKPVRMTTHRANDGNPSWSHDGRWIYFDSNRTGEQQVWKLAADGGDAIQLTRDGAWAPLESPDGKFLYYTKDLGASREPGGTSVWKVPLSGGQAAMVLKGLSTYINLAILDKGIYFVPVPDAVSGTSIQFLDLQKNQIRRIASLERPVGGGDFGGLAISPDGQWILYVQTDQGGAELRLVENFR